MKRIFNQTLSEYCGKDYYPWHMPGHKRQTSLAETIPTLGMGNQLDVTEVPGLDNLNAPEASIAESERELTQVYGSVKSYYLVNGSTCGILTAISACCRQGDTLIMTRNCHKSVYHAVLLLGLKPVYIYPETMEEYGICGSILPEQVEMAFREHPEAKAMVLTSPTYEGVVSDIRTISDTVHKAGAKLIVDEAHGAHMEFGDMFPETAIRCGADLVIESLHKTLPCYTQCAILHIGKGTDQIVSKGTGADRQQELQERVEQYMSMYQTSSPSYLFVANMEDVIAAMDSWRDNRMKEYGKRLKKYRKKWEAYEAIHLLTEEEVRTRGGYDYDCSKLVFCMKGGWSGEAFLNYMEEKYGLVFEMASLHYALAMTSVADTEEAFERLDRALAATEQLLRERKDQEAGDEFEVHPEGNGSARRSSTYTYSPCKEDAREVLTPAQAWNRETETVTPEEAAGRIAGDYVTVYPPGIPQLVPGELIGAGEVTYLETCRKAGLTIYGIAEGRIKVLKEILKENPEEDEKNSNL